MEFNLLTLNKFQTLELGLHHSVIEISCFPILCLLGDETVTNVFRDFSNMASQNPEKLRRDRHTNV